MPAPDSSNPFLEIMNVAGKVDPGALVTVWANLPPHPPGFTGDLFERFDDIDRDGDGFISLDELDAACASRDFVSHHAAALAALRRVLDDIDDLADDEVGWEDDGVTRADLAGFDLVHHADPKDELVTKALGRYARAKKKIAKAPKTVFEDEESPSVDPLSCRQGLMGDCFFLAPLMALALQDHRRLLSMIRKHPVRADAWRIYFRGADDAITVEAPTDAEIALFASADGLWPIIFEKAYGIHAFGKAYSMLASTTLDAVDGGLAGPAIRALTGNDVDVDVLPSTRKSTTRAKLIEALSVQKVVVAQVLKSLLKEKKTADGLVRAHLYSVLSFDASSDIVYVRNPWGNDDGGLIGAEISDGCFKMPLDSLDSNFGIMFYEQ
jgi:hypothetical protein